MRLRNKFIIVTASLMISAILLSGGIALAQTIADHVGSQPPQPDGQINNSGEPIVAGKVITINNAVLTIANEGNVAYNIDISRAMIAKGNVSGSAADIAVGDYLLVQGTVNGTAVAASLVIDQAIVAETAYFTSSQAIESPAEQKDINGFWISIARFFLDFFSYFRN